VANDKTQNKGKFVTKTVTRPAIEVDCKDWLDTSSGWTFGSFVSKTVTRPAIEVDCSDWGKEPPAWLEVVISMDRSVSPIKVFEQTVRVIHSLHDEYRRQGLTLQYDTGRSRTEGDQVIVALRLASPPSDELRDRAIAITRAEMAKVSGAKLERVGLVQAA
jgi:hypothetical protein